MEIIFEGPDKTGKSTSALNISKGDVIYNLTKEVYNGLAPADPGTIRCFDRIDWFTHAVYRLALPEHEWNDPRVRTVFSMPDAHLVIKYHNPVTAPLVDDELYTWGTVARVSKMYYDVGLGLIRLNACQGYKLFKTISMIEVTKTASGFRQRMTEFSSPVTFYKKRSLGHVTTDEQLIQVLEHEEQNR